MTIGYSRPFKTVVQTCATALCVLTSTSIMPVLAQDEDSGDISLPMVSISGPSSSVPEGTGLTFTLTLDTAPPLGTSLTVNLTVSETGEAVNESNKAESQEVTISGTEATFTVATVDDDVDEAASTVTVQIDTDSADPMTYTVDSQSSSAMGIVNDNDLPIVGFGDLPTGVTEGEDAVFTFEREGDLSVVLVVDLITTSSTFSQTLGFQFLGMLSTSITFAAGEQIATLRVSTEDDDIDQDGYEVTVSLSKTVGSNVNRFRLRDDAFSSVSDNINVNDNDTRGVTVTGSPVAVDEGSTATYSVVLTSEPTADVTVTPESDDTNAVTVSPNALIFTMANWNVEQSVTVTGVNHTMDPGVTINHTITGGDYGSVTVDDVTVNVTDFTLPMVNSITRHNPPTFSTNANSLTWRVEFSEDVTNVDTTDFTVTGTTATITSVVPVSGQMDVYEVTASGGNLNNLEGTVTLDFAMNPDIADATGNIFDGTMPTGVNANSYEVDTIAPMVTITGVPATSSEPFTATITFSEPVDVLMQGDITVNNAELSDFTLVTTSGTDPNRAWTVLVTPTADGMVTLDIAADAAMDAADNGNTAAQATSTFTAPMMNNDDTIAPTVTSVTRQDPMNSPTSADSLTWRVEFSEVVTNVDTTDFMVTGTTATITSVVPVSGQTDVYDVAASGGNLDALDGRVMLGFAVDQNIADVGGNALSDTDSMGTDDNFYDLKNTAQDDSTEQQSVRFPEAYSSRFGRTVGEQTVAAVRNRISTDRSAGFQGQIARQSISLRESGNAGQTSAHNRPVFLTLLEQGVNAMSPLPTTLPSSWSLTSEEVLLGTSFAFMRDTDAGMSLGFWGQASQSGFDGHSVVGDVDGRVTGVQLGADWRQGASLFGLMVSRSRGSGGIADTVPVEIKSDLTALVPYGSVEVSSTLSLWGAAGLGRGDITFTPTGGASTRTDIDWSMLTGGARGALGNAAALGGASLDWIADALWTKTRSDALPGAPSSATSGDTMRVRAGVEASWAQVLDSGSIQTPRLSLGLRHDGGDAETGMGLEISGGFDWRDASGGLSFGVEGRALALHDDGDYRDWGVGLNFSYDPRPDTQRGFSMVFTQGLGVSTSGDVTSLMTSGSFPTGFDSSDGESRWSVEASRGTSRSLGMVSSPYVRLSGGGTDQTRDLRLGYRVGPDVSHALDMNLDVWAEPSINAGQPVEVGASLHWNW